MFVVTDLTRFSSGNPDVCTALIDMETGACVRPMPYFKFDAVKKHCVLPGAIFTGGFTPSAGRSAPHVEDCGYSDLKFHGPATGVQFRDALNKSLHSAVATGFNAQLTFGQKVLPLSSPPPRSIVTIKVSSTDIEIVPDLYNDRKIKIHFRDESGFQFRFMPITDLGFHDHASAHRNAGDLNIINEHLQSSDEIFLRVGLSREHTSPDGRCGYWIQVNGIYTFPSKLNLVRGYSA